MINPHKIAENLCIKAEKLGLDAPTEGMIAECLNDTICNVLNFPIETARAIPGNEESTAMKMFRELAALTARLATAERERDGAIAAREESLNHVYSVAAERDQALKDLAHVKASLDAFTRACDKARDERDQLSAQVLAMRGALEYGWQQHKRLLESERSKSKGDTWDFWNFLIEKIDAALSRESASAQEEA